MRGLVVVVMMLGVVGASPAQAKPGAIIIPPAEVDIGAGTPVGDVDVGPATEVRVGVHWASLYWKPTPIDVGFGYVGSYRDVAPSFAERTTSSDDDQSLALHGMYFSAAYAIEKHKHWRTWVGARVEGMSGNYGGRSYTVIGGALRLAAELYSTGVGAGGGNRAAAFFAGAFALGVYVEGTKRGLPAELGPIGVGAGITMRVPFIAAVGD